MKLISGVKGRERIRFLQTHNFDRRIKCEQFIVPSVPYMNPFVKPILVVLLLGMLTVGVLFPAVPAHADIYRYTDENGVMHITNLPTSSDYKLWIKERRVIIKAGIDMTKYGPLIQ